MNRQVENLGHIVSRVFYDFSDLFNLTKVVPNQNRVVKVFIKNDSEALKSDWNEVGKEFKISIEEYGSDEHKRIEGKSKEPVGSV